MQHAARKKKSLKRFIKDNWVGAVFVAPVFIGIAVFTAWPMLQSLYFSFFSEYNVISPPAGFGLLNLRRMFVYDDDLWKAIGVTFTYAVINVPLTMVLSFMLAVLLNRKHKGIGVYRVLIYLPVIIPVTVNGLLWRNVTDVQYGIANKFLTTLGLPASTFFEEAASCMPSFIILGLWSLGGGMILWLSSLKNVPQELYEAAEIDGANAAVRLFRITIPMCTPMIFYNLVMNIIGALQTFGTVYTLTGGSSGKDNALLFWMMKIYNDAFDINGATMGYACAVSWLLFFVIAVLTAVVFKTSRWVFYGEEA